MAQIQIGDHPEDGRYVIEVDGVQAGRLLYRREDDRITFTHAETDPGHEGQGLGSKLTAHALDEARARGLDVLPRCPFVQAYVQRHPEYADLVPEEHRARFGL